MTSLSLPRKSSAEQIRLLIGQDRQYHLPNGTIIIEHLFILRHTFRHGICVFMSHNLRVIDYVASLKKHFIFELTYKYKRVNGSYKLICDLAFFIFINDLEPDAKHGSIIRNLFLVNKPNKGQNLFSAWVRT